MYPVYSVNVENYTGSLRKALDAGWISSQGEFIDKARDICQDVIGTPHAVLTNNGTSSTHLLYLALRRAGVKTVYVPNHVFVAVWNCALYEYDAADIRVLKTDPNTLNMSLDLSGIEYGSGVVVVHNLGNVVDVPRLKTLRPDLVFVEDCCEAFLETYPDGRKTGTASLCAALSFFGNKTVTTGEGGLWYTNDKDLYDHIYKTCHHGYTSERYVYDVLGYNYRMTNLQAALLYDQMRDIDAILAQKRRIRDRYIRLLTGSVTSGLWMNVFRFPGASYPAIAEAMNFHGVDTRPMFYDIGRHCHLKDIVVEDESIGHGEIVMLPSYPTLSVYDQVYIANALLQALGNSGLKLERITAANRALLDTFAARTLPDTFRYFKTRTVDQCLETHALTLVGTVDGVAIAYGHLDDRWIGLCVVPEHQGKGWGSRILKFLMDYADLSDIRPLRLSVDKTNTTAYQMYTRRGFAVVRETSASYFMEKHTDDQTSGVDR